MKIKFGIQEKTTLLVIVLVALTAMVAPLSLFHLTREALYDHETVDLGDEADLRAWELNELVRRAMDDTRLWSGDAFEREKLRRLRVVPSNERDTRWRPYVRVETVSEDGSGGEVLIEDIDRLPSPELANLVNQLQVANAGDVLITPIHRVQVAAAAEEEGGEDYWIPVICAGARLFGSAADTPGIVVATVNLEPSASTRHFTIWSDPEAGEEVYHTNRHSESDFPNEEAFRKVKNHVFETAQSTLLAAVEPGVKRLAYKPQQQLAQPYYFGQGEPNRELLDFIAADVTNTDLEPIAEAWQKRYSPFMRRADGLTGGVRQVRLLAPSPEELKVMQREVERDLSESFLGEYYKRIKWQPAVRCENLDTWVVGLRLKNIATETGVSSRLYLLYHAGFSEELASSIQKDIAKMARMTGVFTAGAGIVAFLLTLYFILPLKRITKTAQSVAASDESDHEPLIKRVETLRESLPVERKDEVGDIAHALERLFEEIQASHRDLEGRVTERTRELEKARDDLEDANVELQSLSREKDAFLANVSHELRNPLNVVDGNLQFLEMSELDEEQMADVKKCRRAARRLLELINEILDYQKIIMGGIDLCEEEIDLPVFLSEIRESLEFQAAESGNELVFEIVGDIGKMKTANKRLRQMLVNLLSNACKFTDKGTVRLTASREQVSSGTAAGAREWIDFEISDTGRGMTPEEQAKIFDPFYTNKKGNESGTGLGLAITRSLSELMGGEVACVKSAPGEGTTFRLRLPDRRGGDEIAGDGKKPVSHLQPEGNEPVGDGTRKVAREAASAPAAADGTGPAAADTGSGTEGDAGAEGREIVVIDDDPEVRDLMKRFLESAGHHVQTAVDGTEGIELVRRIHPAVVLLDIMMPGLDGWDVLHVLKSDPATASIPVVIVTILDRQEKGFAVGADEYLTKPVDRDHLSSVIERLTTRTAKGTVLVVDDEEASREIVTRALSGEGWEIVKAGDGEEALEILERVEPDAIILDLIMPHMDGFEFLAHYRKKWAARKCPVIVMTGKDRTEEERLLLEQSVVKVLEKGASAQDRLLDEIRSLVEHYSHLGPGENEPE